MQIKIDVTYGNAQAMRAVTVPDTAAAVLAEHHGGEAALVRAIAEAAVELCAGLEHHPAIVRGAANDAAAAPVEEHAEPKRGRKHK